MLNRILYSLSFLVVLFVGGSLLLNHGNLPIGTAFGAALTLLFIAVALNPYGSK